jgi:hypothetical protein
MPSFVTWRERPVRSSARNQSCSGVVPGLAHDAANVGFGRTRTAPECPPDLVVRKPSEEEFHHSVFGRGKPPLHGPSSRSAQPVPPVCHFLGGTWHRLRRNRGFPGRHISCKAGDAGSRLGPRIAPNPSIPMTKLACLPPRPRSSVDPPKYPRALFAALVTASLSGCAGIVVDSGAESAGGGTPNVGGGMAMPFDSGGTSSVGGSAGAAGQTNLPGGGGQGGVAGAGAAAGTSPAGGTGTDLNPAGGIAAPFTTGGSQG